MIKVRKAQNKDIAKIIDLLKQVLEVHANIRPDIFISGTTKYTEDEIKELIKDNSNPIYVAVNDNDECLAYVFCKYHERLLSNNMLPSKSIFIDDFCVDECMRGQHIGEILFKYVIEEAKNMGCNEINLNVWEGNYIAENFYEKMGMKTKRRLMEYTL